MRSKTSSRGFGLAAFGVAAALLGLALAGGTGLVRPAMAQASAPKVAGAWVRLPAATGRPAAGYLEITAAPGDALVAVSSPRAGRVELHSMSMVDGVMRMRAESRLAVPAAGRLSLAPGGNHLMLFDLAADVKPGERIPLKLRFASGSELSVSAEARTPGSAGGHSH